MIRHVATTAQVVGSTSSIDVDAGEDHGSARRELDDAFDVVKPSSSCYVPAVTAVCGLWCLVLLIGVMLLFWRSDEPYPEHSATASPRTTWSAKSKMQKKQWFQYQEKLVGAATSYHPGPDANGHGRLVLIGDSITESWRGTSYGDSTQRAVGMPEVLQQTLGNIWTDPLVLAISGDQTQHVLWRLANGELSGKMAADPSMLVVLLIGTNNLGRGFLPEDSHAGIIAVVETLLRNTRGKVLVNALFPRGDGKYILRHLCPPRCNRKGLPFDSFLPAVESVNRLTAASVEKLAVEFPGRVKFVDCGEPYTSPPGDKEEVKLSLMPDRLHPSADGQRLWAECLQPALLQLESSSQS